MRTAKDSYGKGGECTCKQKDDQRVCDPYWRTLELAKGSYAIRKGSRENRAHEGK